MPSNQAWPEQLALRLDERSLRGLARVHRGDGELRVFVPYTCPELTKAALAQAAALTRNLTADITLFAVHVVPYPRPLDEPDVSAVFLEQKLASMARDAAAEADVRIVFTREPEAGREQILPPHSLVVVATKKRWWPTVEAKLARSLAREGHSVALLGV